VTTKKRKSAGLKDDGNKVDWAILKYAPLEDVVRVFMMGEEKYDRHNYLEVEDWETRYWNAAMRHMVAHQRGEYMDPESGLPHLAHAVASLLMHMANQDHHGTRGYPR